MLIVPSPLILYEVHPRICGKNLYYIYWVIICSFQMYIPFVGVRLDVCLKSEKGEILLFLFYCLASANSQLLISYKYDAY